MPPDKSTEVVSAAAGDEAGNGAGAAQKPRPHGPAKGLAGVGITAEEVNNAIEKGRDGVEKRGFALLFRYRQSRFEVFEPTRANGQQTLPPSDPSAISGIDPWDKQLL